MGEKQQEYYGIGRAFYAINAFIKVGVLGQTKQAELYRTTAYQVQGIRESLNDMTPQVPGAAVRC